MATTNQIRLIQRLTSELGLTFTPADAAEARALSAGHASLVIADLIHRKRQRDTQGRPTNRAAPRTG